MRQKTLPIMFALALFFIMFTSIIPLGHSIEWSPEMRLTWKNDIDTFPSVTQTSDGLIWVVWCSFRTGNPEIFCKFYNGSSVHPWSPETQLTDDTNSDLTPSVTQALDGSIWVVWTSNRTGNHEIYYKTYDGTTWLPDQLLFTDPGEDRNPSIMQATDGTLWVLWESKLLDEYDFDIYYATSSDNGENWSIQILPVSCLGIDEHSPSIAEATDGSIWVVWEMSGDLFYSVYDGTSWSSPPTQLTTDPYFDVRPSIAQAQDGTIWVVWDSDRNLEDEDIYYKTLTETWSEDTALIIDSYIDFAPSILPALDGTVWVIWSSTRLDNMDIYYITNSTPDENDVAIFSVLPSTTMISQGENVTIEVMAQNKGTNPQTFQVSCYTETFLIGSKTITVNPGQLNLTRFHWNTSSFSIGDYVISAEASTVAGETNTADNTYIDGTVTVVKHDVAVESVTPSKTIGHRGYRLYIYVGVRNEGNFTEAIEVTAYYNSTAMGTQTLTGLAPDANAVLGFPWSAGAPYGYYTISAKAKPVPHEYDTTDNSLTDGSVIVTIPGDVNGDRTVSILDAGAISAHWYPGPPAGPSGYDPNADIDNDGKIGICDAAIVSSHWQESW